MSTEYQNAIDDVLRTIDKLQTYAHQVMFPPTYAGGGALGRQGSITFLVNKQLLINSVKSLGEENMVSSTKNLFGSEPEPTPEVQTPEPKVELHIPTINDIAVAVSNDGMELKYIGGEWCIIEGTKAAVKLQAVLEYMFVNNVDRLTAFRAFCV